MTDQLRSEELYALVRRTLPAIDAETLSPTGAQARAVFDRVIASDRLAVTSPHAFVDEENEDIQIARRPRGRALLTFVAPIGVVAAAVAAILLIVTLISPSSTSRRPGTAQPHGVVAVGARLLAALTEASNDVVKVSGQTERTSSGLTTCPATRWFYPFDVQTGGEFQELLEGDCNHDLYESAIDITAETVTPYVLATPASQATQNLPVAYDGPSADVGESVCGTGSFSGFSTARGKPTGTQWRSTVETLRVPAPATSELLRSELKAGSLRLVGNTTIGGAPAIELSVLVPTASNSGYTVTEKFWVDPSTFLPIRRVTSFEPKPGPGNAAPAPFLATGGDVVQTFSFLPPIPANLALLHVVVLSGLTRVAAGAQFTTRSCSAPFPGRPGYRG